MQESREQGDSLRPGLLYDRFCASADTMGCFGTQIWIRRSSGVVLDNFEAVSPQLVVARVRFHGVVLSVISAHAPHEFRTSEVENTFWESVRAVVAFASAAGDEVALLGDFNARLGTVCSAVLEIHDKEVENQNGAMFRHTLEGCNLIASSTWHRASNRLRLFLSQVPRNGVYHPHSKGPSAPCEEWC